MPPQICTTGLSGSFKNNLGGPQHRNALPGLVITHKACRWTSGPFCLLSELNGRCFAVPQGQACLPRRGSLRRRQARIAQWFVCVYRGERTRLAGHVRRPRRTHGPVGGAPTGAAEPSSVAVLRRVEAAALPTPNADRMEERESLELRLGRAAHSKAYSCPVL